MYNTRALLPVLAAVLLLLASCSPAPPENSPAAPAVSDEAQRFTLVAVGDLMVHEEQLREAAGGGGFDFSHCFSPVRSDLLEGDLTLGNLETVFAGPREGHSGFPLFNTPDSFGEALADNGFTLLSTANNHCLDFGAEGISRTAKTLDGLGLAHTGTFPEGEREPFLLLETVGGSIAVLAYTAGVNQVPPPPGQERLVNLLEEERVAKDLEAVHDLSPDLVVVMAHMGLEYAAEPSAEQLRMADQLLYLGADVVLASHPHVLQPMEVRFVTDRYGRARNRFVIYSLGNFLSSQREVPRDAGGLFKLDFRREDSLVLEQVRFVPTWVQFRDRAGNPFIRVISTGDALESPGEYSLHPGDLERIRRAHSDAATLYPPYSTGDGQREYLLYSR